MRTKTGGGERNGISLWETMSHLSSKCGNPHSALASPSSLDPRVRWQEAVPGVRSGKDCHTISLMVDLCPSHLKAYVFVFRLAIHLPHCGMVRILPLDHQCHLCHCRSSVTFDFFLGFSLALPRQFLHGLARFHHFQPPKTFKPLCV